MKKALILAAGVGKRLGILTKDVPKCLLPVGLDNRSTLIDFLLEVLKENKIKEIIFVCGYAQEKLKEHIEKNWGEEFTFKFVFNEKYNEYNNIYSAYIARYLWDDETVLLNSDIIFSPQILTNLILQIKKENYQKSYLVIDDTELLTEEDMKITLDAGKRIKKINKNLNPGDSYGEYIGIFYLTGAERIKFIESLQKNVSDSNFDLYYEDALDCILNNISVYPFSTEGHLWTEVDTKEDLKFAKEIALKLKKVVAS